MKLLAGFGVVQVRHDGLDGDIYLGGFSGRGPMTGVHQYPEIRTLFLTDQETAVALISCDYVYFDHDFIQSIRRDLFKKGISSVVACTHNHGAPATFHSVDDRVGRVHEGYLEQVRESIHESVALARHSKRAVEAASVGRVELIGNLTMNRNILTEREGGPWLHKRLELDTPARVFQEVDRDLTVLRLTLENGPLNDLVLVNMACHPILCDRDNTTCTRDFVGPLLDLLEAAPGRKALFINGAAGDVNPAVWGYGQQVAETFGRFVGIQAEVAIDSAVRINPELRVAEGVFSLDNWAGQTFEVPVTALWIGAQALITAPGELYSSSGREVQSGWDLRPMIVGYANGTAGYLPPREIMEAPRLYQHETGLRSLVEFPNLPSHPTNPHGVYLTDVADQFVITARSLLES